MLLIVYLYIYRYTIESIGLLIISGSPNPNLCFLVPPTHQPTGPSIGPPSQALYIFSKILIPLFPSLGRHPQHPPPQSLTSTHGGATSPLPRRGSRPPAPVMPTSSNARRRSHSAATLARSASRSARQHDSSRSHRCSSRSQRCSSRSHHASESPSLVLVINDTKLLMLCVEVI